jgi:uncharacterized tellurite resistance protein B-like protein
MIALTSGRLELANNGWNAARADGAFVRLEDHPAGKHLKTLVIENNTTQDVNWVISFSR